MAAMDFKRAGDRVRSLIASKKPQQQQTSALGPDKLRDNIVSEEIAESPRFRATSNQIPRVEFDKETEDGQTVRESFEWDTFPEAIRDVARAGFSWEEPELARRENIRPSHQFNREVLDRIVRSEEFRESRPYTRDNAPESLFGAMAASNTIREHAQEVAEHIARSQDMSEQEQQIDDADQMLENLRKRAKQQHDAAGQVDPNLVSQIKQQVSKRQQARGQLQNLVDQHQGSNAKQAAAGLAKQAAQAHQDAVEGIGSLPGLDPGQAHNLTADQQIALAEKWAANPQLREIAKMVGRLVRDMRFKRQARTKNVAVEPVGIVTGRDIARMLPHELARAHMPALRPVWIKDWSARALLEWEMGGKTPAGRGPIIFVYDGSGSMTGEPFIWASSVGLALLSIAQREKRAFAGVEFGSPGQLKSWFFPAREQADADQVIDFASHFFGGGTSIVTGMAEAKRIIDTQPEFKTADVVIASDGQDYFREPDAQIVRELQAKDVRLHGISILCPNNAYLEAACEYTVDVQDLAGSNDATDALAEQIT